MATGAYIGPIETGPNNLLYNGFALIISSRLWLEAVSAQHQFITEGLHVYPGVYLILFTF